jgi:hypothetical protein
MPESLGLAAARSAQGLLRSHPLTVDTAGTENARLRARMDTQAVDRYENVGSLVYVFDDTAGSPGAIQRAQRKRQVGCRSLKRSISRMGEPTLGRTSRNSGEIPKRPTGADCKSAGSRLRWFESTSLHQVRQVRDAQAARQRTRQHPGVVQHPPAQYPSRLFRRGSSSMVELQPSKLIVRVRFPSPAPLNR